MNHSDWPFYIRNVAQLQAEAERLGLRLPIAEGSAILRQNLPLESRQLPNRWCAQPVSGNDANSDGTPSQLTLRRYLRLAAGGFGLIWMEGVPAETPRRLREGQLFLASENLDSFASFAERLRAEALERHGHRLVLILQINHRGGFFPREAEPSPSEQLTLSELETARSELAARAGLAADAGFDGIDLNCSMNTTPALLLSEFGRKDRYGGSIENRARLIIETLQSIKSANPKLLLAVRINVFCAAERGFGTDRRDYRIPAPAEPAKLSAMMAEAGVEIINLKTNSPNLRSPSSRRWLEPFFDFQLGDEHPLTTIARNLALAAELREAAPNVAFVLGGWSWLKELLIFAAAGALKEGAADIIGLGRPALACPEMPISLTRNKTINPNECCTLCDACSELALAGMRVGCATRDSSIYRAEYRTMKRFSMDRLLSEAAKCRLCRAESCREAVPGNLDIPGFIRAFERDSIEEAFSIIRASIILPEMSAQLAFGPPQQMGESYCSETIFSGRAVAIRDIMLTVCRMARERGLTGVRVPEGAPSGRRVALLGGGPAGIAAAARLVELGHLATIFERTGALGGVPELLIPDSRFSGADEEIQALLAPALDAGRLTLCLSAEFGRGSLSLEKLFADFDAVLLATGLWRNRTREALPGAVDAVDFLKLSKRGEWKANLDATVLIAGGDCAMDAAETALAHGAKNLYIVFSGARSEMHWCAEESVFARQGVHAMMLTRPLSVQVGSGKRIEGLRVCPVLLSPSGERRIEREKEYLISADLVLEAGGLAPEQELLNALPEAIVRDDGLLATRSQGSFQTAADRLFAAGALINGGASVPQCVSEGMLAAAEIDSMLISGAG